MLMIGTHMSIAGGLAKTAENVVKMEANTMQIFSRNPRGSNFRIPTEKEIEKFQKIRKEYNFGPILAHAPYTMNLASAKPEVYEFACDVIREDIQRMDSFGIENIVFHPGSHTGIGVEAGIQNIIRGLDQAITEDQNITVLLETMSGKGTEIGYRFEELKAIRDGVKHPEKVGVCLDTCHIFAAGYDIVNQLDEVLNEFDEILESMKEQKQVWLTVEEAEYALKVVRFAITTCEAVNEHKDKLWNFASLLHRRIEQAEGKL